MSQHLPHGPESTGPLPDWPHDRFPAPPARTRLDGRTEKAKRVLMWTTTALLALLILNLVVADALALYGYIEMRAAFTSIDEAYDPSLWDGCVQGFDPLGEPC